MSLPTVDDISLLVGSFVMQQLHGNNVIACIRDNCGVECKVEHNSIQQFKENILSISI